MKPVTEMGRALAPAPSNVVVLWQSGMPVAL